VVRRLTERLLFSRVRFDVCSEYIVSDSFTYVDIMIELKFVCGISEELDV
jgi:hypothetical protein